MLVTQEFVDEYFRKVCGRENINKVTPEQFVLLFITNPRRLGKQTINLSLLKAFLSMLESYNGTNTIVSSDIHITTTGVPLDWQKRFNDITQVIEHKFPKEPSKKKAKFKQSKFDQINSFGKKKCQQ